MGAYDNLIPKVPLARPQPTVGSSNPYDRLIPKIPLARPSGSSVTPTNPYAKLIPRNIPTKPEYWSGSVEGTSFGPSETLDPSGRPLLDYKRPGDISTTTDKLRTAVSFDPTIAAPQDRKLFYNPRAVESRAELKSQMGGTYSDELDHKIALALSGSNMLENLQIEPGIKGGTAAQNDVLETRLARAVTEGKLSLFDAQTSLAKVKGLQIITGKIEKNYLTGEGVADDTTAGIVRNTILGLPKAFLEVGVDILQSIARSVGTVGITAGNVPMDIANRILGTSEPLPFDQSIPTTGSKITETLFGGKPIKTIQKQTEDVKAFLKPFIGETGSDLSALPLVVGSIIIDLTGWGGKAGVNSFTKGEVPKAFLRFLAKETKEESIFNTLKGIGLDAKRSKILAPELAKTKTIDEVVDVLVAFEKTDDAAKIVAKEIATPKTGVAKTTDIVGDALRAREKALIDQGWLKKPEVPLDISKKVQEIKPKVTDEIQVSPEMEAKANVEWESNPVLGERVGELQQKVDALETKIIKSKSVAAKETNLKIQKQVDSLNNEIGKIQEDFVSKWQEEAKAEMKGYGVSVTDEIVNEIISGKTKIAVGKMSKEEARNILGDNYMRFFTKDPNAQALDEVITKARNAGEDITTDDLLRKIADRMQQRKVAKYSDEGIPISTRKVEARIQKREAAVKEKISQDTKKVADSVENIYRREVKTQPQLENRTLEQLDILVSQAQGKDIGRRSLAEMIAKEPTSVNEKVGALDYWRTPDRVFKKIGLEKAFNMLRKGNDAYVAELPLQMDEIVKIKGNTPKDEYAKIFDHIDGQVEDVNNPLTKENLEVAKNIDEWFEVWANRLGLPEDRRISHYITHIFEQDFIKKEFDEDLAKIIANKIPGQVYDPFLEERLGAKGFIKDPFKAMEAYAKRATRKVHMDPALEQLKKDAAGMEKSQVEYVKAFADHVNLRPTNIDTLIDNTIKQMFGYRFGQRPTASLSRKARQLVYRGALGLNFGSATKNLTQGINTFTVIGEKYTAIGYSKLLTSFNSPELEASGVLSNDMIQDRIVTATEKAMQAADKTLFFVFETAERINRGAAYFGAKQKALDEGKTLTEAIEYAKQIVRDTQFTFGQIDTPVAMQSDIVKTFMQFGTFPLKQAEFAFERFQKKDWAGIARFIAATFFIVYAFGKAFNIKYSDFSPIAIFGRIGAMPPVLTLPSAIYGAAMDKPGYFGQKRDVVEKLKDVGNAGIIYIPGGIQISKTFKGINLYNEGDVPQTKLNLLKAATMGAKNLEATPSKEVTAAKSALSEAGKEKTAVRDAFKATYNKIQNMSTEEKQKAVNALSEEEYALYKSFKTSSKTKATLTAEQSMVATVQKVQELKESGKIDEAKVIVNKLSDEDYRIYLLTKKKLNIK